MIVKVIADDGLVGWGECTRADDAAGIASAVAAMRPIILGRDPFEMEAIAHDMFVAGAWQFGSSREPTLLRAPYGQPRT